MYEYNFCYKSEKPVVGGHNEQAGAVVKDISVVSKVKIVETWKAARKPLWSARRFQKEACVKLAHTNYRRISRAEGRLLFSGPRRRIALGIVLYLPASRGPEDGLLLP